MATPETIHKELIGATNRREFDAMRALMHPEYSYVGSDGSKIEGGDALIELLHGYVAGLPDLEFEIQRVYIDGNTAVAEMRCRGTHTGDLAGIAPTGKKIDIGFCNVMVVKDGMCVEERDYYDTLAMMVQLGVLESPMQG
jgi:steroid delta-isomerase-like uncharacterized protein